MFLTVECHAYLAPFECHTIYFLKSVVSGSKRFIDNDRVRYLSLPQYEDLTIRDILQQALDSGKCHDYLPEPDEFGKLPRQWLINLAYTLVGQPFADWAWGILEARNQRLMDEQKLGIDIDPEILRRFTQSTAVSSKFGRWSLGSRRRNISLLVYNSLEGHRRPPLEVWV